MAKNHLNIKTLLEIIDKKKSITFKNILKELKKRDIIYKDDSVESSLAGILKKRHARLENINGKGRECFILTELGKEVLNGKVIKKVKEVKKRSNKLPVDINTEEKPGNWLEWTKPEYIEENQRWEFYKKQENIIIEIYHSESEEEILEKHKEIVMSHITAELKSQNQTAPYNNKEIKPEDKKINKRGDTSSYIHESAKFRILDLKLKGESYPNIIDTIQKEYNLNHMTIGLYFTDVLKDIRERSKGIIQETLQLHLERYEELFKWFRENNYSKTALKVLERKERLMGLHGTENIEGGLLNILTDNKGSLKTRYEWSLLSEIEYKRLLALVKRTVIKLEKENELKT